MDRGAIERLSEFFERMNEAIPNNPEITELKAFVDRWKVDCLMVDPAAARSEPQNQYSQHRPSAIILIHGWGGTAEKSFGDLPNYIEKISKIPTFVYQYPTGWITASPSIAFIARNLDNWIRINAPGRRLCLVGHSMGGVITRYLTIIQEIRTRPLKIRQISLLASPTGGAAIANIASKLPFFRSAQLEELNPNSSFLNELNSRWHIWKNKNVPCNCHVGTMFAMNDAIVNYASAIGFDPDAVPIYNEDHQSIVKPQSDTHDVVLTLARFLSESPLAKA